MKPKLPEPIAGIVFDVDGDPQSFVNKESCCDKDVTAVYTANQMIDYATDCVLEAMRTMLILLGRN